MPRLPMTLVMGSQAISTTPACLSSVLAILTSLSSDSVCLNRTCCLCTASEFLRTVEKLDSKRHVLLHRQRDHKRCALSRYAAVRNGPLMSRNYLPDDRQSQPSPVVFCRLK